MAIQDITYNDKVAITQNPLLPLVNQVTADDMNEIKEVVNNNGVEVIAQVAQLNSSILLNSQDITQNTTSINGIIADMNDFNIDINANFRTFTIPANSSIPVTLDRGIYYISRGTNMSKFNINSESNIWYNSLSAIVENPYINISTAPCLFIYGKNNCWLFGIGSVEAYQSKIPIVEITSFFNSFAGGESVIGMVKIKSFN